MLLQNLKTEDVVAIYSHDIFECYMLHKLPDTKMRYVISPEDYTYIRESILIKEEGPRIFEVYQHFIVQRALVKDIFISPSEVKINMGDFMFEAYCSRSERRDILDSFSYCSQSSAIYSGQGNSTTRFFQKIKDNFVRFKHNVFPEPRYMGGALVQSQRCDDELCS